MTVLDERTLSTDCFGSRMVLRTGVKGDSWIDFIPADKDHDAPFALTSELRVQIARELLTGTDYMIRRHPEDPS